MKSWYNAEKSMLFLIHLPCTGCFIHDYYIWAEKLKTEYTVYISSNQIPKDVYEIHILA